MSYTEVKSFDSIPFSIPYYPHTNEKDKTRTWKNTSAMPRILAMLDNLESKKSVLKNVETEHCVAPWLHRNVVRFGSMTLPPSPISSWLISVSSFRNPKLLIDDRTIPRFNVGKFGSMQKWNSCVYGRGGNVASSKSTVPEVGRNGLPVSKSHSNTSAITRGVDDCACTTVWTTFPNSPSSCSCSCSSSSSSSIGTCKKRLQLHRTNMLPCALLLRRIPTIFFFFLSRLSRRNACLYRLFLLESSRCLVRVRWFSYGC